MRRQRIDEVEEAWTLGPDEHALLSGKRGATRLGFAVTLRFFSRHERFPAAGEIGEDAVEHVASQVGVAAADAKYWSETYGSEMLYERARARVFVEHEVDGTVALYRVRGENADGFACELVSGEPMIFSRGKRVELGEAA